MCSSRATVLGYLPELRQSGIAMRKMVQNQGDGDKIRPADEIRDDLEEVSIKHEEVLEEGQRKLGVAEDRDRNREEPAYGEERVRLRNDAIAPLEGTAGQADQAIQDLDNGTITPAQAQQKLEELSKVVEDAAVTVDDVGDFDDDDDDDIDDDDDDEDEDEE